MEENLVVIMRSVGSGWEENNNMNQQRTIVREASQLGKY
jgi:hypothetical protein